MEYKYLVVKQGHVLTGFNDEQEAMEYAKKHNATIKKN
jgi:hypothetical protein